MRVRILLLLILKSRTLTTITQRIERGVKKSGIMQQYSGTPGVKSNFRDYPGKSGRVGRSAGRAVSIDLTGCVFNLRGGNFKRHAICPAGSRVIEAVKG